MFNADISNGAFYAYYKEYHSVHGTEENKTTTEKQKKKKQRNSMKIIKYGKVQEVTHAHSLGGLLDQAHTVEVKFSAS